MRFTSTPVQETLNVSNVTQIASPILPEQSTSSINNYELSVSTSPSNEQNSFSMYGRRIININHFFGE